MAVKLHRVFWLGLWLACLLVPGRLPAALTPERLYQKVLPSVMTLEVETQTGEKFVGSAVLARADDVALSAWHLVADARSVWAVFANGQRVKVTGCIAHDALRDVAALKLEKRFPQRQATLSRKLPAVAARAYVIGTPRGYDFSISDGLISQIRNVNGQLQYQLSCPISPGNSGSPVLNQRGEVIGIASWTKSNAQNVSFAIPAQAFTQLNISAPPHTWKQLAATAKAGSPASLRTAHPASDKALELQADADSFIAFQDWLDAAVGKSVTVVVQDAGRTNTFKFTVK